MKKFLVMAVVSRDTEFENQDFTEFEVPLLMTETPSGFSICLREAGVASTWEANELDPDMLRCLRKQLCKISRIDLTNCTTEVEASKMLTNYEQFDAVHDYTFDLTIKVFK